jgi:hypothetical protein
VASTRRKLLIAVAAASVLLLVGVLLAATMTWRSPRLGAAVLGKVGELGGIEVEATDFRLALLRGLELRGVTARADLENGRLEATMDRMLLEHQLLPLLRRQVVVDRLVLEKPELRLVAAGTTTTRVARGDETGSAAAGAGARADGAAAVDAADGAAPDGAGRRVDVELAQVVVEDGSLLVRDESRDATLVDLRGLDLELRDLRLDPAAAAAVVGLRADGTLAAESLALETLRAEDIEGTVELRDGHVWLRDLEVPANLGRFRVAELDVDLTSDPYRFAVGVTGDPLDTQVMLGAAGGTLGTARLQLLTRGGLGESLDLDGSGTLSLELGRLPDHPVLAGLERLLPKLPVVGALYEPFEIRFRLDGEDIVAQLFQIAAGELRLEAEGVIGLDHSLDLRFVARAPRALLESPEVPKEVLEALTDAEGLVALPIVVQGSREAPEVRFDESQWGRLLRNRVRQELEREVGKRLGGLLRRPRDGD